MTLAIIVATDKQGLIGKNNTLPWRLSADLRYFRRVTMGNAIIMGRRTHQSIGKALPGRKNIVVSANSNYHAQGCTVIHSMADALQVCKSTREVFIIGGASLYQQLLPHIDKLYLTLVHTKLKGDSYFPQWDKAKWRQLSREDHLADSNNNYDYSFIVYQRTGTQFN